MELDLARKNVRTLLPPRKRGPPPSRAPFCAPRAPGSFRCELYRAANTARRAKNYRYALARSTHPPALASAKKL